jgi:predicted HD phosphohydrolase
MISIEEVLALYSRWGSHHYDEDLAQADHALQTAAHAEASGAGEALVVAALLHDVGHLLALVTPGPIQPHETSGAAYLAQLFPPAVTAPVAMHVEAKRYLCAVEPDYAASLSAGSTRSLARQGGPMTEEEAATFRNTSGWAGAVSLRRWDDHGKASITVSRTVEFYRPLLVSLAAGPR